MKWTEVWEETTQDEQKALEAELKREVILGHPLYNMSVSAIARRTDCDDVLFAVAGSSSVAVVHLSYGVETNPFWPPTQFFGSLDEWKERYKP